MDFRSLGRTGIEVSTISLGTVSLGMPYGIKSPGEFGVPSRNEAIRLLQNAAEAGINLFDTAPSYGNSEELLGEAFSNRSDLFMATKVSVPAIQGTQQRREAFRKSLTDSLRNMRREVLDIVQVHNATEKDLADGEITEWLLQAKNEGLVRFLGASVYGVDAAAAVVRTNCYDVVQIAYSILDQRPLVSFFSLASRQDTGLLVRSALLKGVLTRKVSALPGPMATLKSASDRARMQLGCSWQELPQIALRFCLSRKEVSSVLLGVRNREELNQGVEAWSQGPLSEKLLRRTPALALNEENWVNPSYWPIP